MRPICVSCQRFYRCKKNGFAFIEQMPKGEKATPGTSAPEQWTPYKLWMGDLWECQGCGHTLIGGVALQPVSEHFKPDFAAQAQALRADFQVNDC